MPASRSVRVIWVLAVAFFVVTGLWPFVSPDTFFDALVAFPPYNAHLMRDIGVFTLGSAGALLAALRFKDALLVALIGASTAPSLTSSPISWIPTRAEIQPTSHCSPCSRRSS
jgi:hypothetical protein